MTNRSSPHPLREAADMQAGFEMIARLIMNAWASRIIQYSSKRADRPIADAYDLAAVTFDSAFPNGRHIRKLPPKLQMFVKTAIKRHIRIAADGEADEQKGVWHAHIYQPEIILNFKDAAFKHLQARGLGNFYAVSEFLQTRFDTLVHELVHAYDFYLSKGDSFATPQAHRARQAKSALKRDSSYDERKRWYDLYLQQPHEINARFYQTVQRLWRYVRQPWKEYLQRFKSEFPGWSLLSPVEKRRLYARLATEWVSHRHQDIPLDPKPFCQKLNASLRAEISPELWIYERHGAIDLDGLGKLSPDDQRKVLRKVAFIADIIRANVVTYDKTPVMQEFGFVANKGRKKDFRFSAPFYRPPTPRPAPAPTMYPATL